MTIEQAKIELETIIDAIKDPIFLHNNELKIIRVNKAYCEAAGMSYHRILGRPYYTIFPVTDVPLKMCAGHQELVEDEIFIPSMEKTFKTRCFPVNNVKASPNFFVHILEDITKEKKAEEKLNEEVEIKRALLNIAESITTTFNLDEMLRKVINIVSGIVAGERYVIFLWDKGQGAFIPAQTLGVPLELIPELRRLKLTTDIPVVERLLLGETVSMDDIEKCGLCPEEIRMKIGIKCCLCVPVKTGNEIIGFISVKRISIDRLFKRRDELFLKGVSHQLAIALDNIRLYKAMTDKSLELSQRDETIKIMHEMDLSTLSILEESELIETLVQLVSRLIPADIIIIAKVDNERNGFVYKAGYGLPLSKDTFFPFNYTSAAEVIIKKRTKFIPDLILENDMHPFQDMLIENGYRSGVIAPLIAKGKIIGIFHVGNRKTGVFNKDHLSVLEGLSAQIAVSLDNLGLVQDLKDMVVNIFRTLSAMIDAKSPWTSGHSERVTKYALEIAREMGLDEKDLKDLELAGLLHDIGKVGTYDIILDKAGELNEEEIKIMQQHPVKGVEILTPIKQLQGIIPVIKYHHEFYNGEGYPEGLKGRDIPLMARIIAVADTVDAMRADRPYRRGRSMDTIVDELKRCSGSQFDPEVVTSFRLSLL
ncbi:MAG: GAF domain-containing protein [Nitrospirae bacterium]|nr:GAF domain-containing protein [Nitrospirota bacterium]